ncbi:invasion associated locus B family protein [Rhizobium deserti]|nr:invasion associated locus B family protein [Rhizobium deserti]
MFSTPASRSTTGAPILNNPSVGPNSGIIDSAGGGTNTGAPAARPAARTEPQAATPAQTGAVAEHFGGWEVQCMSMAAASKICQVSSKVTSPDGSQVILVMSLANDVGNDAVRMQMAVPLGIALAEKINISVAPSHETSLFVSRCTPQGCLVEGAVEPALMKAMREGEQAIVSVATPEGKRIPITLGLKGLSAALDALKANGTAVR